MHRLLLVAALVAAFPIVLGCGGPKGSCEGSVNALARCINNQDSECAEELLWEPHRKKFGSRAIKVWFTNEYDGWKNMRFTTIRAVETGDLCIAQSQYSYTWKIRGKNPIDHEDEYQSWLAHRVDGYWYLEMPGVSKVQGF